MSVAMHPWRLTTTRKHTSFNRSRERMSVATTNELNEQYTLEELAFQSLQGAHVHCNNRPKSLLCGILQNVSIAPGSACPLQHEGLVQPRHPEVEVSIAPGSACPLQPDNRPSSDFYSLKFQSLQGAHVRCNPPMYPHFTVVVTLGFNRSRERMSVATSAIADLELDLARKFQSLQGAHVRCNDKIEKLSVK